jgi:hypothetical protein
MQAMEVVPGDLSPDYNHLSIQGHRDYAAIAWPALIAAQVVPESSRAAGSAWRRYRIGKSYVRRTLDPTREMSVP